MKTRLSIQILIGFFVLMGGLHYGYCVCHLHNYVSSCILNILDEHIEATAIINHCHLPLDVTFLISYQYKNSTIHKWKYTFVTTNQNERVMIPGLLLPISPHAPVFLYARVPEHEFNMHNSSFVAIQASFIAELDTDRWEEADFLNHTVFIPSTKDCHFNKSGSDPIPWIIGGLFIVTLLSGSFGAGCYFYRRRKMAVDQMALVSAMEVGLPGSQPYQMDPTAEENSENQETSENNQENQENRETPNKNTENNKEKLDNEQEISNTDKERSGKKGFKFGRLKEEVSIPNALGNLRDSSFIIGNPAYRDNNLGNNPVKNNSNGEPKNSLDQHYIMENEMQNGNQNGMQNGNQNGMQNNCFQEEESESTKNNQQTENGVSDDDIPENKEVLDDDQSLVFENGESGSNGQQVGQGAKRKVRGVSGTLNGPSSSSTIIEAENSTESQKSL